MVLVLKGIVNQCQRKLYLLFISPKRRLTSCTLLTRQSVSVIKVGVPNGSKAFQRPKYFPIKRLLLSEEILNTIYIATTKYMQDYDR